MVIVTDDADHENEGDLIMAAEKVTPQAVNFMVTHARGLGCERGHAIAFREVGPDVEENERVGAGERFVIYDVAPGEAELVAEGEFVPAVMKGENRFKSLAKGEMIVPGEEAQAKPGELDKPPEDKVVAKLEFLQGCAAVYAASCRPDDIALLHLSIGSAVNDVFVSLPCRKAILYHNVTPPRYFEKVNRKTAYSLEKGLQQTRALAGAAIGMTR